MGAFRGTKNCIVCNKKVEEGIGFWMGHIHTRTGKTTAGFCSDDCQLKAYFESSKDPSFCGSGCYGRKK
jgi:hypothetical protein